MRASPIISNTSCLQIPSKAIKLTAIGYGWGKKSDYGHQRKKVKEGTGQVPKIGFSLSLSGEYDLLLPRTDVKQHSESTTCHALSLRGKVLLVLCKETFLINFLPNQVISVSKWTNTIWVNLPCKLHCCSFWFGQPHSKSSCWHIQCVTTPQTYLVISGSHMIS